MAKKTSKLPLPIVGKRYHFFDDGKTGPSRHYIATVEEIITKDEAKARYLPTADKNIIKMLYEIWEGEVEHRDFLYAKDTDVFVRCSIPKYDENQIWFVRTKDGGLFSIDVQSFWQSGRLDIDGHIYKEVKEYFDKDHYDGYYDEMSGTEKIN